MIGIDRSVTISPRRPQMAWALTAAIAFALGGEAGRRLAAALGMPAGVDTLLRLVRAAPSSSSDAPQALGIDDSAWRKATRYGTPGVRIIEHRQRGVNSLTGARGGYILAPYTPPGYLAKERRP